MCRTVVSLRCALLDAVAGALLAPLPCVSGARAPCWFTTARHVPLRSGAVSDAAHSPAAQNALSVNILRTNANVAALEFTAAPSDRQVPTMHEPRALVACHIWQYGPCSAFQLEPCDDLADRVSPGMPFDPLEQMGAAEQKGLCNGGLVHQQDVGFDGGRVQHEQQVPGDTPVPTHLDLSLVPCCTPLRVT